MCLTLFDLCSFKSISLSGREKIRKKWWWWGCVLDTSVINHTIRERKESSQGRGNKRQSQSFNRKERITWKRSSRTLFALSSCSCPTPSTHPLYSESPELQSGFPLRRKNEKEKGLFRKRQTYKYIDSMGRQQANDGPKRSQFFFVSLECKKVKQAEE
jgi:hypothetical protein